MGNGRYWQASAKIQWFNIAKQAARRGRLPQPGKVSCWPKTAPEQVFEKKPMLQDIHEKYPGAQLVVIDIDNDVLNRVQSFIKEGRLPENTVLIKAE